MAHPIERWFTELADVYGDADDFATVIKSGLRCTLQHISTAGASSGVDRAELMQQRLLLFDPSYDMPEESQVELDGVRWQSQRGTFALLERRLDGTPAYRRALVVRARGS